MKNSADIMAKIIDTTTIFIDKMLFKIHSMGYSIYVVMAVILILLLMMLVSRRHKWLLWLILIITSIVCAFMLYYIAADIRILLFIRLDNLLSSLQDNMRLIGGGVLLGIIVLSGLLSMITGKKRRRGLLHSDDYGYDYDDNDFDDDDGGDDDD